jgi:hypothetical protein
MMAYVSPTIESGLHLSNHMTTLKKYTRLKLQINPTAL